MSTTLRFVQEARKDSSVRPSRDQKQGSVPAAKADAAAPEANHIQGDPQDEVAHIMISWLGVSDLFDGCQLPCPGSLENLSTTTTTR